MVVVVLMSVVILGLTAMFTQTQRAFKAGISQTDVLEAGRMGTEMLSRELEQIIPSYAATNSFNGAGINFYTLLWNEFSMNLPANTSLHTNLISDLFFLVHENQTWTGIGYFWVRDPNHQGTPTDPVPVGTLYRFETNVPSAQFAQNPGGLFTGYDRARRGISTPNVSKILDGVVSFNFRAYDTNGYWINPAGPITPIGQIWNQSDWSANFPIASYPPQVDYHFVSNAVPAFVEFELGIVEQGALDHYRSIPIYTVQTNYMAKQAGRVHLFRQRVAVRNVDRSAY